MYHYVRLDRVRLCSVLGLGILLLTFGGCAICASIVEPPVAGQATPLNPGPVTPSPRSCSGTQMVVVGKKVLTASGYEAGRLSTKQLPVEQSILAPIPAGESVRWAMVRVSSLVVDDKVHRAGTSEAVFEYAVLLSAPGADLSQPATLVASSRVALRVGETNVLLLREGANRRIDSARVLRLSLDSSAVRGHRQYYVEIPFNPCAEGSLRVQVLALPTFTYQWVTLQGAGDIDFD